MKLSKPKNVTWWISLVLAALGLTGYLKVIPAISPYSFWFVLAGFILLLLGTLLKGL